MSDIADIAAVPLGAVEPLLAPAPPPVTVAHAAGVPITVLPDDYIGTRVVQSGFYDLCVSEALLRLSDPGDRVVDVGANVGAMTAVLARAVGPTGHVLCYEPQPDIARVLRRNAMRWSSEPDLAQVEVRELAVGEAPAVLSFGQPRFSHDCSDARLTPAGSDDVVLYDVSVVALDEEVDAAEIVKLDVEDAEAAFLRGASRLLGTGAIRDLVFEDFEVDEAGSSQVCEALVAHGYVLLRLGLEEDGLACTTDIASTSVDNGDEPPCFVATRDPARVLERLSARGFRLLSGGPR